MKNFYKTFLACVTLLLAVSCTTSPNSGLATEPVDVSVSENPLNDNILGTWRGVIPCADCPGINYNLTLNEDRSFEETLIYQDRSAQPFTQTGTWRVNNGVVELNSRTEERSRFGLSDNELLMLDPGTGRPIETRVANMYRLRRDPRVTQPVMSVWSDSRKQGVDFVGHGNNPGWVLEVDHEKDVVFQTLPLQEISISAATPKPFTSGNTTRYTVQVGNGKLEVELTKSSCTDSMSGEVSAYTVKVTAQGTTYTGCGLFLDEAPDVK